MKSVCKQKTEEITDYATFFQTILKLKGQELIKPTNSTFWCQYLSDQTPAFT